MKQRFDPSSINRVVVKVGSSSIIRTDGMVRLGFLGKLVTTIGKLRRQGVEIVLVSSGAIAMGAKRLDRIERPIRIPDKQACAAVGQNELMTLYEKLFSTLQIRTGQVLLTREDLEDRRRYLNAREALLYLMEIAVVPVVNENDSVAVDEIKFGDNDELSALVAGLVSADLLVLLTDVDGLYKKDPHSDPEARIIGTVNKPVDELLDVANGKTGPFGLGGMRTKIEAARLCQSYGIPCVIARSRGSVLEKVLQGEQVGTFVEPLRTRVDARSRWLAAAAHVHGELILDKGAARALVQGGKSLLPIGILKVTGEFLRGAVVVAKDEAGREIGRGQVRYASEDLQRIHGHQGNEIESILGFTFGDEVIHCDDLALMV